MKKKLTIALALTLCSLSAAAQDWSVGVGSGAFIFGDFVERRMRPVAGDTVSDPRIQTLSAGTRPGLAVSIEHGFAPRWAVRLEGTFTRAPLALKSKEGDNDEFELDAGDLDVMTLKLPIVFRINTGGAFRFHIMGGPAFASYRPEGRENAAGTVTVFDGTRNRWGATAGFGVTWHISDRFAVEGQISDTVTSSPFDRDDYPDVPGIDIPKPHNVHTVLGARYRF